MPNRWILLAEDNEDDLALALRAIKRLGVDMQIVVARDGEHALNLLGLQDGCELPLNPPELILLDIKMPKQSGIDVLRKLRSCEPYRLVPVVMLTSSDEPSDLLTCYELGANSYTVKPVVYEEFLEQMANTVSYWTEINRIVLPKHAEVRAS